MIFFVLIVDWDVVKPIDVKLYHMLTHEVLLDFFYKHSVDELENGAHHSESSKEKSNNSMPKY